MRRSPPRQRPASGGALRSINCFPFSSLRATQPPDRPLMARSASWRNASRSSAANAGDVASICATAICLLRIASTAFISVRVENRMASRRVSRSLLASCHTMPAVSSMNGSATASASSIRRWRILQPLLDVQGSLLWADASGAGRAALQPAAAAHQTERGRARGPPHLLNSAGRGRSAVAPRRSSCGSSGRPGPASADRPASRPSRGRRRGSGTAPPPSRRPRRESRSARRRSPPS